MNGSSAHAPPVCRLARKRIKGKHSVRTCVPSAAALAAPGCECPAQPRDVPCHAMPCITAVWPVGSGRCIMCKNACHALPCRAVRCDAAHERAGRERTQMRIDLSTEPVTMIFSSYLPSRENAPVRPPAPERASGGSALRCAHTATHRSKSRSKRGLAARVAKAALVPIACEDFVVVC
jgi:hypothetical protein